MGIGGKETHDVDQAYTPDIEAFEPADNKAVRYACAAVVTD